MAHGRTSTSIVLSTHGKGNRIKGRILFNQQKYADVDEWFSHHPDKVVNVSSNLTISTIKARLVNTFLVKLKFFEILGRFKNRTRYLY